MRLSTSIRSALGLPEIVFEIDAEGASFADWMVQYLESETSAGARFENGQTIQVGWSMLKLHQNAEMLELYEPDFRSMPIRWCSGIDNTIRHLVQQRSVCELFGCKPSFPLLTHAGTISPKFLDSHDYTMTREEPSASDSGWVFCETGYPGPEGEFCSLYQLAPQKTAIVPLLALPGGSTVCIRPGFIEATVGGRSISSGDSELLRSLAHDPIRL